MTKVRNMVQGNDGTRKQAMKGKRGMGRKEGKGGAGRA